MSLGNGATTGVFSIDQEFHRPLRIARDLVPGETHVVAIVKR